MSIGDFDIELEKERLLSSGKWFEAGNLDPSRSVFHKPDCSLLVRGNMESGVRIQSDAAVIVQGWVNGSKKNRCYVVADGDVIVEGNVHYAHVKGRTIRIGGEAKRCAMSAAAGIEVGAEVSGAKITVGDFEAERRSVAACWQELQRLRKRNEYNERQYAIDQKRVPREMGRTRFKLDYGIGKVVHHYVVQQTNKQIEINLSPLYDVVEGKSEKEVDLALKEFFTAGVMATLIRANQHLIEVNENRRKVFMGTIHHLQELFWLARTIDKEKVWIEQGESRLEELVDGISDLSAELYTQGPILPQVEVEFGHPVINREPDGKPMIKRDQALYSLRAGREAAAWSVEQTSTQGEVRNRELTPGS